MFPLAALEVIATIGGLIIPPAFDFIKKKFIKAENDTPERTLGTLATTKPEVVADYVNATAKLKEAAVKWFNRDVIGVPSLWVVNLRAVIRPLTVIACISLLAIDGFTTLMVLTIGVRAFCEANISSWMGSRLVSK